MVDFLIHCAFFFLWYILDQLFLLWKSITTPICITKEKNSQNIFWNSL